MSPHSHLCSLFSQQFSKSSYFFSDHPPSVHPYIHSPPPLLSRYTFICLPLHFLPSFLSSIPPFFFLLLILFSLCFLPPSALALFIICHSSSPLSYHSLLFFILLSLSLFLSFSLLPILVPVDTLLIPYRPIRRRLDPEISEQKDRLWSWKEP